MKISVSSKNSSVLEKRKKSFSTVTLGVLVILFLVISPETFLGAAMGGGWVYFLVACAPIAILLVYKKRPDISLVLTSVLVMLFFYLDLNDRVNGVSPELISLTFVIVVALVFQLFSMLIIKNKLDFILIKIPRFIFSMGLVIISGMVLGIENLIFTFLK